MIKFVICSTSVFGCADVGEATVGEVAWPSVEDERGTHTFTKEMCNTRQSLVHAQVQITFKLVIRMQCTCKMDKLDYLT
jgi:hypothetical protein